MCLLLYTVAPKVKVYGVRPPYEILKMTVDESRLASVHAPVLSYLRYILDARITIIEISSLRSSLILSFRRIHHGYDYKRRIPHHGCAASCAHDFRAADDSRQLFPAGLQHGRLDHRRSVRRLRRTGGGRCLCRTDERLHLHRTRRRCRRRCTREPRIRRAQL